MKTDLTDWVLNQIGEILRHFHAKNWEIWLKFHWNFVPMAQSITFQHWFNNGLALNRGQAITRTNTTYSIIKQHWVNCDNIFIKYCSVFGFTTKNPHWGPFHKKNLHPIEILVGNPYSCNSIPGYFVAITILKRVWEQKEVRLNRNYDGQEHVGTCNTPWSTKISTQERRWTSMTPIFNTSQENTKIHIWCKFGDFSSNPLQVITRTSHISENHIMHVWCKFGDCSPNLWQVIAQASQIYYNSK